eukprot:2425866-Rhodomonas_salina.1
MSKMRRLGGVGVRDLVGILLVDDHHGTARGTCPDPAGDREDGCRGERQGRNCNQCQDAGGEEAGRRGGGEHGE